MTNTQKMLEAMSLYPSSWCSDQGEWLDWAMAAKQEGVDYQDFDAWSLQDAARYDESGNRRRWDSLESRAGGLGFGTIATRYLQPRGIIVGQDGDTRPRKAPAKAQSTTTAPQTGVQQCATQIAALFEPGENVAIEPAVPRDGKDHKQRPDTRRGRVFERDALLGILQAAESAGVTELADVQGLDGAVSPDGAYLAINPVTQAGRATANVTAFRHVLIECDDAPKDVQSQVLTRTLALPCTTLVDSGTKSVHALVRVDASSEAQYKEIFNQIAALCKANGLTADPACKDPSRLSRLAGATRVDRDADGIPYEPQPQALLSCDPGSSWTGYVGRVLAEQAEQTQSTTTTTMPRAARIAPDSWDSDNREPVQIAGLARRKLTMIIQGPSKAGKSWCALGLAEATATGGKWLGRFQCRQGPVLYVNFEIDGKSMEERVKVVAREMWRITKDHDEALFRRHVLENIHLLNMRGVCAKTDQFTATITEEAKRIGAVLVIIDPLYMYSDADENSASETKRVLALMGSIGEHSGATVCAVHHYTKGTPGKKQALDRGSGSGVLGRNPDCSIDMAPLDVDEDDTDLADRLGGATPFLVTPTLREFEPMQPFHVVYKHPLHLVCDDDALSKLAVKGADSTTERRAQQSRAESRRREREAAAFKAAWDACSDHRFNRDGLDLVPFSRFYEGLDHDATTGGVSGTERTVKSRVSQSDGFEIWSCSELGIDHKEAGFKRADTSLVARKDQVKARARRKAEQRAQADGASQDVTEATEGASQGAAQLSLTD